MTEVREVSFVTDPKDKRRRIFAISGEDGVRRDEIRALAGHRPPKVPGDIYIGDGPSSRPTRAGQSLLLDAKIAGARL